MPRKAAGLLFVCVAGEMLPRWEEAFPEARARVTAQAFTRPPAAGTEGIWLRLAAGRPVEAQVQRAVAWAAGRPVFVLSDLPGDGEALAVLAAGARGYCNTHAAPALLRRAWAVVAQGGLWVGESLLLRLVRGLARGVPAEAAGEVLGSLSDMDLLTQRERRLLLPLAGGASTRAVAAEVGLPEHAVASSLQSILVKWQLRDRLDLSWRVRRSRESGIRHDSALAQDASRMLEMLHGDTIRVVSHREG